MFFYPFDILGSNGRKHAELHIKKYDVKPVDQIEKDGVELISEEENLENEINDSAEQVGEADGLKYIYKVT